MNSRRFLCFVELAAVIILTRAITAQSACNNSYKDLRDVVWNNSDNVYNISTTFYHPDIENPVYIDVYYHFPNLKVAHYIWASASLYLAIPPRALSFLSLFFTYVAENRIVELHLRLPAECEGLEEMTESTTDNLLFVLTQRLRIYAKYSEGNVERVILPENFQERVVSKKKIHDNFSNTPGVKTFFTLVLVFPFIVLCLCLVYVKGARLHISEYLNNSQHHSTLAALFGVGKMVTIFVAVMDIMSFTVDEEMSTYMVAITAIAFTLEVIMILLNISLISGFCINQCVSDTNGYVKCVFNCLFKCLFKCLFAPILCRNLMSTIKVDEAKLWFLTLGFIPPILSVSSHLGFIIGGWMSFDSQGLAIVLFYMFVLIFLFISFQQLYSMFNLDRDALTKRHQYRPLDDDDENLNKKTELNFPIVLLEIVIGIFICGGTVIYIGSAFSYLPIHDIAASVITRVYTLGQYTVVIAIFILTYNTIYLKKKGGTFVTRSILKYWKYIYKTQKDVQRTRSEEPDITSDADRADALAAVLLFHLLKMKEIDDCKTLLNKIVEDPETTIN